MIKNQLDYLDFRAKKLFYNEHDIYQNWAAISLITLYILHL